MSTKCNVTLPVYHHDQGGYLITRAGFLDLPATLSLSLPIHTVTKGIPPGVSTSKQKPIFKLTKKRITVYPGYWWDGATCGFEFKDFAYAALFHDVLCDAIDAGLIHPKNQKVADILMRRVAIEHGFNRYWAWVRFWAVRLHRNKKASMLMKKFGWHLR